MRAAVLAIAATCGLASAAWAAPVTYSLINPVYNDVATSVGASLNFSLTISDTAVAAGSFSLAGTSGFLPSGNSPSYSGDLADFVSFTANEQATPTHLTGKLSISVTFAADGTVAASSFAYNGLGEMSAMSGTGVIFGGTFGSDNFGFRCGSDACAVTGQLAASAAISPVPEPASLALFGMGVSGLAAIRRRS